MEEFRLGKGHGIRNPFLGRDTEEEDEGRRGRSSEMHLQIFQRLIERMGTRLVKPT
jgi:hypothetical protein